MRRNYRKNYLETFSKIKFILKMNRAISIFTIVLCSLGITGNIISIIVCLQKELRNIPTFVFLTFQSIINIFKLITNPFYLITLQFVFDEIESFDCLFYNTGVFLIFWEFQSLIFFKVR
jgi:hypothetical protein